MARIGIDYTAAVQQAAGIGRYVRELVGALLAQDSENQYRLFAASNTPVLPEHFSSTYLGSSDGNFDLSKPAPNAHFRVLPFHDKWLVRLWHRARIPMPVESIVGRIDLFYSPDFALPPTLPAVPSVLTVHDLSFVKDPDSASPSLQHYLSRVVPRSIKRADHILADSATTRDDLVELWGTPSEKISVIYCGVEPRFQPIVDPQQLSKVRSRYSLGDGPFILSISTIHPRKNYRHLIRAFAPLAARIPDLSLVIGGGRGWNWEPTLAEPARLGLEGKVRFPGFIDDRDLPALYSAAELFVYPSLYEGFGLPVLEAMACGTPVISSNRSSLPEVTGDAGILLDPHDVGSWTAAMERLLIDTGMRSEYIARGTSQATRFSWPVAAQHLSGVLDRQLCH